jgi:transposase
MIRANTTEKFFEKALKIEEPFFVKEVEFREKRELHIHIDFKHGAKFKCPICGKLMPVHDTKQKMWRHLDFFEYEAYLHCRTPRTKCDEHNVHLIDVAWGSSSTGFSLQAEMVIVTRAVHMPVSEIAKEMRENDTRLWRVIIRNVNNARAREDYSGVKEVGVDETSSKRGHNYISIFADMEKAKIIYATEGKDASTVSRFKNDLIEHAGVPQNVTNFSMDMSPAFISGVEEHFKTAFITFDKFHVIKILNKAVDETRREEQLDNPLLKNTRYIWLKNYKNLTSKQEKLFDSLSKKHLKTARAYRIKLVLQDIYNYSNDSIDASEKIEKWLSWVTRSRLPNMKKAGLTIKNNLQGVLNYFDSKLTNGLLEGLNSIIQSAKARARGFRNIDNFIAMVYLLAGKLKFNLT